MILIQIGALEPSYIKGMSQRECLHIRGGVLPFLPQDVTAIQGVLLVNEEVLQRNDVKLGDFGTLVLQNSNASFRPPTSIPQITPPNTIPRPPGLPIF